MSGCDYLEHLLLFVSWVRGTALGCPFLPKVKYVCLQIFASVAASIVPLSGQ